MKVTAVACGAIQSDIYLLASRWNPCVDKQCRRICSRKIL